jgi:hypothetical protein
MRILITVTPRMYRQALAISLHRRRPDFEVRIASPEAAEEEVHTFRPHMIVRTDTDGLDPGVLARVPYWVEVLYSDGMDAKIAVDGRVEEIKDMSTDELLWAADEARRLLASGDGARIP